MKYQFLHLEESLKVNYKSENLNDFMEENIKKKSVPPQRNKNMNAFKIVEEFEQKENSLEGTIFNDPDYLTFIRNIQSTTSPADNNINEKKAWSKVNSVQSKTRTKDENSRKPNAIADFLIKKNLEISYF